MIIFSACGRRLPEHPGKSVSATGEAKCSCPPFLHPRVKFYSEFLTRILSASKVKSRNHSLKKAVAEMMPDMLQYLLSTQCSSGTDVARGIWAFAGKSRLPSRAERVTGHFHSILAGGNAVRNRQGNFGGPLPTRWMDSISSTDLNLNLLPLLAHPRPSISHHPQGPPDRPQHRSNSCLCSCPSLSIDFCSLLSPRASRLTSISHASPHDWKPLGCSYIACSTLYSMCGFH